MPPGRKKKPVQAKVLKGTFRPDRENPNMPAQASDGMKAPEWLPRGALEYFGVLKSRLEELGLNSRTFTEDLAMAALCAYEIERLTVVIECAAKEGIAPTYETKSRVEGLIIKDHPAVNQRLKYIKQYDSLLANFGLNPSAIQKVGAAPRKEEENPFSKLMGR